MSDRDCLAELCSMWDGETCPCETFGLEPDNPPARGIYETRAQFADSCCGQCPGPCYVDQALGN